MKTIKTGSDFSGVGAFDYAINRVAEQKGFEHKRIYACDWDKYARITYIHNHGEPDYYPKDVYDREIPKESLDIYMTSPPCQAFSLAGKRLGKNDERGILFFNSLEFIKENKPRFFIFENVKGLLSDDKGRTFGEWVRLLGGRSVNGLPVIFPDDDSVPYHLYWQVLNSKHHGVPQNRERVFLIGIRDDNDNSFQFPKVEFLNLKMKDLLEDCVDNKYFLSEKMVEYISKDQLGNFHLRLNREISNTITCEVKKMQRSIQDNYVTNNNRVNRCYKSHAQVLEDGDFMDSYNNTIHSEVSPTITTRVTASNSNHIFKKLGIRRLTPRECFRLQDFPETFDFSVVSDSQAYKQAGNSITVRVLEKILLQLPI